MYGLLERSKWVEEARGQGATEEEINYVMQVSSSSTSGGGGSSSSSSISSSSSANSIYRVVVVVLVVVLPRPAPLPPSRVPSSSSSLQELLYHSSHSVREDLTPSGVDLVYSSDDVIREEVRELLVQQVEEHLERKTMKDWHPGSGEQVRREGGGGRRREEGRRELVVIIGVIAQVLVVAVVIVILTTITMTTFPGMVYSGGSMGKG